MQHSFGLLFLWNKQQPLANLDAIAHVSVQSHSKGGYEGHEDAILLTSQCVTLKELEYEIDRLKGELEDVREAARKKFASLGEFKAECTLRRRE
jgi:hypothetical protein